MRGIVVSTPMSISKTAFSIEAAGLDPQLLRVWTLFWDKLDHPDSNIVSFGSDPDGAFLASEGILQRTKVVWTSNLSNGDVFLKPHMEAYRTLDAQQPGTWSLAMGPNTLQIPDDEQDQGRGVYVRLVGALPVPDADVPLAELLSFKRKRHAELDALHHHLTNVYQSILVSPDKPLVENESVRALSRAVDDQLKVSRESGLKMRLTDLLSNFDIAGGIAGWQAASSAGLNAQSCAIASVAGAGIGVGISNALRARKKPGSPYGYVVRYHSELFHL